MIFTSGAAAMAVAVGGNDNFSSMYATCFNVIGPALKRVFKSSDFLEVLDWLPGSCKRVQVTHRCGFLFCTITPVDHLSVICTYKQFINVIVLGRMYAVDPRSQEFPIA
jgi:hypothetical protein